MLALLFALLQNPAPDLLRATLREVVDEWIKPPEPRGSPQFASRSGAALKALRGRLRSGARLDSECWRTILVDGGFLKWRERWPIGERYAIGLFTPPISTSLTLQLQPKCAGWRSAHADSRFGMCAYGNDLADEAEGYQELGLLRREQRSIRFMVVATDREGLFPPSATDVSLAAATGRWDSSTVLGEIELPVVPVARIEDVFEPILDQEIAAALASRARLEILATRTGGWRSWFQIHRFHPPPDVSCNLRVEIVRNDWTLSTSHLRVNSTARGRPACPLPKLPSSLVTGKEPAQGWKLRLVGTAEGALRNWDATHFWSGEIEVDLATLLR